MSGDQFCMTFLNNRIPPPVIALALAFCMRALKDIGPQFLWPEMVVLLLSLLCFAVGLALEVPAVFAFWRQKTTVNPLNIEAAKHLVVSGAYRFTRNPMYLGMCFLLIGWAIGQHNILAFAGPVLFVLYITLFQILPEERVLADIFGKHYLDYKNKVRRWI
jgi:protein-S-isoprenylcysteine O-methyltransferase Ste14